MQYKEVWGSLFDAPKESYLGHCISSDFQMGAGIAVEFEKRFRLRSKLFNEKPDYETFFSKQGKDYGDCILVKNVFNLVTKRKYWGKPTYRSLKESLKKMRKIADENEVKEISLPKIGAGLDRLQWVEVSKIIQEVFETSDIEITIYKL